MGYSGKILVFLSFLASIFVNKKAEGREHYGGIQA